MEGELGELALRAASTVVTLLATDAWGKAKSGIGSLWRRAHPDDADVLEEELEETRDKILAARDRGDEKVESAVVQDWESRLGRLLDAFPDLATELRRMLDEEFTSAMPGTGQTNKSTTIIASGRSPVIKADGNVYHSEGDQHIHYDGGPPPHGIPDPPDGKRSKRRRLVAIMSVIIVIVVVTALVAWLAGSRGIPLRAAGKPSGVPAEDGLLDSSDLGGLNLELKQTDLQIPVSSVKGSATCGKGNLNPISAPVREFSESPKWFSTEVIEAFPSQGAARQAYEINSSRIKCEYSPSTNISSEVSGLGENEYAAEAHYSSKSGGLTEAAYIGVILSGRYVLVLAVQTPLDNSFDQVSAFSLYTNAAVHKAGKLPGA